MGVGESNCVCIQVCCMCAHDVEYMHTVFIPLQLQHESDRTAYDNEHWFTA